jgi:hypothetical protein
MVEKDCHETCTIAMVLSDYISKDAFYQGMTERTENPPNPDCLSATISNLFERVDKSL